MAISKWFKVLVVGGATLTSVGCADPEPTQPDASPDARPLDGSRPDGSAPDASAADADVPDAPSPDAMSSLECSDPPQAGDPCGCPCCWADGVLPNTDPACAGFCSAGNGGAGCCDM